MKFRLCIYQAPAYCIKASGSTYAEYKEQQERSAVQHHEIIDLYYTYTKVTFGVHTDT